jgi:hypothetical protein
MAHLDVLVLPRGRVIVNGSRQCVLDEALERSIFVDLVEQCQVSQPLRLALGVCGVELPDPDGELSIRVRDGRLQHLPPAAIVITATLADFPEYPSWLRAPAVSDVPVCTTSAAQPLTVDAVVAALPHAPMNFTVGRRLVFRKVGSHEDAVVIEAGALSGVSCSWRPPGAAAYMTLWRQPLSGDTLDAAVDAVFSDDSLECVSDSIPADI